MKKSICFMVGALFSLSTAVAAGLTEKQEVDLCRAAISTVMGAPIESISGKYEKGISVINYKRRLDGKGFSNSCRIEGNRIVWRAWFNDHLTKGWGRWRDSPQDDVVIYEFSGKGVVITASTSDGDVFAKENYDFN